MTGKRMAQTRGGKRLWRGWSASTKGCTRVVLVEAGGGTMRRRQGSGGSTRDARCTTYHSQRPDGVVDEDEGGGQKHGEADEFVKLHGGGGTEQMSVQP